ncbi:hypothetical protein [Primorskyibacter sp. S187A]|uniref:hypothetical protein n=1 Tax=Primorskyibacter sp. S187A TaxID=3415130 RepID=UPI003C7C1DD8
MFGVIGDIVGGVVDFFTGGSQDDEAPDDPCNVGTCAAARAVRNSASNAVNVNCLHARFHLWLVLTAANLVTLPITAYIGILIIAFLLGGLGGVAIAIGIYIFLLIFLLAWAPVLRAVIELLARTYAAEGEAIARVRNECPPECQTDMTPTPCDLGTGGDVSVPSNGLTQWIGIAQSFRLG